MEAQDPLSELRDIHLPADPAFWPPAFGWWLLAALLLALAVVGARLLLRAYIHRRRRAAALAALDESLRRYRARATERPEDADRAGLDFLNEVNAVLKRVALARYPADTVSHLHGQAWLAFLDSLDGGDTFRAGPGAALGEGPYRPRFDADVDAVYQAARRWIDNRYRMTRQPPRRWRARQGGAGS